MCNKNHYKNCILLFKKIFQGNPENKWYKQLTIEPIVMLYMLVHHLSVIPEESFIIKKTHGINEVLQIQELERNYSQILTFNYYDKYVSFVYECIFDKFNYIENVYI